MQGRNHPSLGNQAVCSLHPFSPVCGKRGELQGAQSGLGSNPALQMRRSFPGVPANILGMLVSGPESPAGPEICLLLKYPRGSVELTTTIPTLKCWACPAGEQVPAEAAQAAALMEGGQQETARPGQLPCSPGVTHKPNLTQASVRGQILSAPLSRICSLNSSSAQKAPFPEANPLLMDPGPLDVSQHKPLLADNWDVSR